MPLGHKKQRKNQTEMDHPQKRHLQKSAQSTGDTPADSAAPTTGDGLTANTHRTDAAADGSSEDTKESQPAEPWTEEMMYFPSVDGLVLVPHLKVTVGSGGTARRANGRDGLALGDSVAHVDQELGAMGVVSQKAIGVGEDHQVAIGPLHPGKEDRAVCRRVDGGPGRSRDVDASVAVILPKDVAVAKVRGDGASDGP